MESLFFGHEKGSFTGADKLKPGMVEVAHTGTLFLDEIGEMPPGLQAKLLRFIQEKTFRRVGGAQEHRVDVRVIAATNRDLEAMVREKSFRADLFYRLQVIVLMVPPLRDRVADIVPLAREFLDRFSRRSRKTVEGFTERAERILETYSWPGNVRELENTIERLVVFCRGEVIGSSDVANVLGLPAATLEAENSPEVKVDVALPVELPWKDFRDLGLRALRKPYAEKLLELTGGNVTEAARRAGVARRSFYRLLQEPEDESETPSARAVPRQSPEIQA
jgi:transcriptional regulator with PAS, ATPase and Fis domain